MGFFYWRVFKRADSFRQRWGIDRTIDSRTPGRSLLAHHFGPEWTFSSTIKRISMNNSRDIHSFEAMNPPEFGDPPPTSPGALPWSWPLWFWFIVAVTILVCSSQKWPFFGEEGGAGEDILIRSEDTLGRLFYHNLILHITLYWRNSDWDHTLIRKLLTEVINKVRSRVIF